MLEHVQHALLVDGPGSVSPALSARCLLQGALRLAPVPARLCQAGAAQFGLQLSTGATGCDAGGMALCLVCTSTSDRADAGGLLERHATDGHRWHSGLGP